MRDLPFDDSSSSAGSGAFLDEDFADARKAGTVIGSRAPGGVSRRGVDRERRIAIDHGALRFQPLLKPGWGRQGIAYGPFAREPGLAFAVAITNGHNTSQRTSIVEGIVRRLWRWVRGPGADPVPSRLRALLLGPRKRGLARRINGWLRATRPFYQGPDIDENLAVGWFGAVAPADPTSDGCGFVVHAALGDNGEVWARNGPRCLPAFRGLKNVRVYYLVVLRERGAICYAAAGPDVKTLPEAPMMRPVAIDPYDQGSQVYAGVHQAVLGQIGFRVDTRVHGVKVRLLPELAVAAPGQIGDALTGDGPLDRPGLGWRILRGAVRRTDRGACAEGGALALLERPQQTGLIHAILDRARPEGAAGIVWRQVDAENFWALEIDKAAARLVRTEAGLRRVIATDDERGTALDGTHSIQILDTPDKVGCYIDGAQLFGGWIETAPEARPTRVGLWFAEGSAAAWRDFECHPREVSVPAELRFAAPWRRFGSKKLVADRFGGFGEALDGRSPDVGPDRWRRIVGRGAVETTGEGARVKASVPAPNPGRTFHAIPWPQHGFADLEAMIQPPGSGRGEKEHCRSGVVFWQDEDNYLSFSVYLSDEYDGASIALFTKRFGFEELYDAVWTMVGDAITWGETFTLRVTFDGDRFVVFVGGEAVMERALTDLYPDDPPLRINQVGLATNWEWGDDTGSIFRRFVARA
jgi:hypothetical protein